MCHVAPPSLRRTGVKTMGKHPREETGLDILADRLALVLNGIKRPIKPDEIDLRMVAELAWAFGVNVAVAISSTALDNGVENHG